MVYPVSGYNLGQHYQILRAAPHLPSEVRRSAENQWRDAENDVQIMTYSWFGCIWNVPSPSSVIRSS